MAQMTVNANQLTSPAWAGDYLNREHLLPGGAKVAAADFDADDDGRKPIRSGTLLGRTIAERDAGTALGAAADADEEFYLLAFDVTDALQNNDVELYRHGSLVKENFLPAFSGLSDALKSAIRDNYECTKGVN